MSEKGETSGKRNEDSETVPCNQGGKKSIKSDKKKDHSMDNKEEKGENINTVNLKVDLQCECQGHFDTIENCLKKLKAKGVISWTVGMTNGVAKMTVNYQSITKEKIHKKLQKALGKKKVELM